GDDRLRRRAPERARGPPRQLETGRAGAGLPHGARLRGVPPVLAVLVAARAHDRLGGQLRPRAPPPADRDQGRLGHRPARRDLRGRLPLRRDLRRDRALARERPSRGDQLPRPVSAAVLTGKRAVVTGASQGIGAAAAVALARAGANVAFDYKSATAEAERTAAAVREAGSEAIVLQGDTGDPSHVSELGRRAVDAWGGIDVWVNNA